MNPLSKYPDTIVIVGAGFSSYAGLPLQNEFTEAMVRGSKIGDPTSNLMQRIRTFVGTSFDHSEKAESRFWPALEDIFTAIDLSANAGHYLGSYKAHDLRDLRRTLIAVMIWTLNEAYESAPNSATDKRKRKELARLVQNLDLGRTAFISMNWDTVIERKLAETHGVKNFDYGCEAIRAMPPGTKGDCVRVYPAAGDIGPTARIIKMHGSVNWLYCDRCQGLYWFQPETSIAGQILSKTLAKRYGEPWASETRWFCTNCNDVELTTRIATFSYRKALDFPMFQKSWFSAELLLRNAARWAFIGYSMPGADFEFKYLLKRVQLSCEPPEVIVVTGGGPTAVEAARINYHRFFGRGIKRKKTFFGNGLDNDSIAAITS